MLNPIPFLVRHNIPAEYHVDLCRYMLVELKLLPLTIRDVLNSEEFQAAAREWRIAASEAFIDEVF